MALDFPNSPTNGQVYTDAGTGEQWVYDAPTNSWTSKGLINTSGGLQFKGSLDITAAPPTGLSPGWQYSSSTTGTPNAGFTGLTGTIAKGDVVMYTGTGWTVQSHSVPEATAVVKGIDTQKWSRTGTTLSPATAGDVVTMSLGTAALPGLTPVGDPNTGVFSAGADQVGLATNGVGRLFISSTGKIGIGDSSPLEVFEVRDGNIGLDSAGSAVGDRTAERFYKRTDNGSSNGMAAIGMNGTGTNGFLGEIKFYTGASDVFSASLSERVRIDGFGKLLVGTSTVYGISGLGTPDVQLSRANKDATLAVTAWKGDNAVFNPTLQFMRSYNNTAGTHTAVPVNASLGSVRFAGSDGAGFFSGAEITANADGKAWAPGDCPARIILSTTPTGALVPVERMRITQAGDLAHGTAGLPIVPTSGTVDGLYYDNAGKQAVLSRNGGGPLILRRRTSDGIIQGFYRDGTVVGAINVSTTDLTIANATSGSIVFNRATSSESARIDGSGRLLVGASAARTNFYNATNTAQAQLEGTNYQNAAFAIVCNAASLDKGSFIIAKSRGAALGSNTIVLANDNLGSVEFQGSNGTHFVQAANIKTEVDGTPSATSMPGRLVLSTTPTGAVAPVTRMTIKASGVINIANATVYADNTAAKAGGLVAGDIYRKATGELMVTF